MTDRDPPKIPPLERCHLSVDQLQELVSLVRTHGRDVEVSIRHRDRGDAPIQVPTLDDVVPALCASDTAQVQVRYLYDNALWMDTFMHAPEGLVAVRIRHEAD